MRTTTLTTLTATAGCALLLLVAGCSSSSPTNAAPTDTPTTGPLSAYFERVSGGYNQEQYAALAAKSEEAVAACMLDLGFEYTPQDMSKQASLTQDVATDFGSEDFAAKQGYGMTTSMNASSDDASTTSDQWVDPNADYLATMSETEQQAFYEALYGAQSAATADMTDTTDEATATEYNWEDAGCQGKAQHEVYETGAYAAFADPAFTSLQEEMSTVYDSLQNDSRLTEVEAAWSSCMSDAGFDFATAQDAPNSISDQLNELHNGASSAATAGTDATEVSTPDPQVIADLQKTEIATAVADARCKKSVDYDAKYQKVQFALEQEFVDAHKTELDAWADAFSQATK